jgi:phosphoketolase
MMNPQSEPRTRRADEAPDHGRFEEAAAALRAADGRFARWAAGFGVIRHTEQTQVRVHEMVAELCRERPARPAELYDVLAAADRVACASMWLVVHMSYARSVYLDGRRLDTDDFKPEPEGHTGGALNMSVGYVGYLTANALCGLTRSWLMEQGHCVAAIDASNLLIGNMLPEHAERYGLSDEKLSRFVRDFYSYAVRADGRAESPVGSHVNPFTAGGVSEGGYLGFAGLTYIHMPLPGDRLVAFLSDGAFEEQRGPDWAPRWWRGEDTGLVAPIMIANGRRIDQRTTMAQHCREGGVGWFHRHLRLNGFDPIDVDGRDPASIAWAVFEMERRLRARHAAVTRGEARYPVPLPYAVAETIKGFGFPGAGGNAAHNLPLGANPSVDAGARERFNDGAARLWVPPDELLAAARTLAGHERDGRPLERDHSIALRRIEHVALPEPRWLGVEPGARSGAASPMDAIDEYFCAVVRANPALRPRVGNPDEMRSNRMNRTLDLLKHRVTDPEPGIPECLDGGVITALNEEAVVAAVLANTGGIGIAVSYEAFAVKMLGAIRQDLIFARHQRAAGRPPGWVSVPVVATSHTWENGKNEQSHQDPTLAEALLGEMSDVSRVAFPCDWNSAAATLRRVYRGRGEVWTLVVPKRPVPARFTQAQAAALVDDGAVRLRGTGAEPVCIAALGAYQLTEALRAAERLEQRGAGCMVVYILEPSRFRAPRDAAEARFIQGGGSDDGSGERQDAARRERLFPAGATARVILTHTRPEPLLGVLRPLDTGPGRTIALGYTNHGGTLDTNGLLFANRCTWAHAVAAAARAAGRDPADLLSRAELDAVHGRAAPAGILF